MRRLTSFTEGHHYQIDPETGCWNWQLVRDRKGYGRSSGPDNRAHRASWIFTNGPIPDGLVIDHLCRNKSCINPAHLEVVRQAVNTWRGAVAKITPEIAEEIRERLRAGDSQAQIARDYGVTDMVPYWIAEDKGWRVDPSAPRQPIRVERDCLTCGQRLVGGLRHRRYCDAKCRSKRPNGAAFRSRRVDQ